MKSKKIIALFTASALLLALAGCTPKENEVKNVILMISDGTSVSIPTLSRWYTSYDKETNHFDTQTKLNLDPLVSGLIRTYWQDADGSIGALTDSAPGGTAISTGSKSQDKFIGYSWDNHPQATILELAESLGKSTGLVATTHIQHATPAAFAAHTTDREDFYTIASQILEADVDVVLGGGTKFMLPENRPDGRDLISEVKQAGFDYLTTKDELNNFNGEKVYGIFADTFMEYDIDRELLNPTQPTLEEMTSKAIETLSKNKDGFFLMIEGSKVDWGAHNNDPASVISEFLAFDKAVAKALSFAQERDDTILIILEDHGTGGVSIGSSQSDKNYSSYPLSDIVCPLSNAKITANGVLELLADGKDSKEVLSLYGINDPTAEELEYITNLQPDLGVSTSESRHTLGHMLSKRCNIGWTTGGHTGEDIPLYSYLPGNKRITGLLENTDIVKIITDAWGAELTPDVCKHNLNK